MKKKRIGRKEGRNVGRKEGRKEGKKEGRKEEKMEGRKKVKKEGRSLSFLFNSFYLSLILIFPLSYPCFTVSFSFTQSLSPSEVSLKCVLAVVAQRIGIVTVTYDVPKSQCSCTSRLLWHKWNIYS